MVFNFIDLVTSINWIGEFLFFVCFIFGFRIRNSASARAFFLDRLMLSGSG